MNAQQYIQETLSQLSQPVQREAIGTIALEDGIYAKVMSKKFRKLKADPDAADITRKAIRTSIDAGKPVKVNLIFGGNKLWRFDEAPEIDWAEIFATCYALRWMKSIASVYEPGAYLEFYSEDVVLKHMNNLPRSETDQYSQTFMAMLDWLRQYIPKGVSVGYKRYGDEYNDESEYLAELEQAKRKVLSELGGTLPVLTEQQRDAILLNVRPRPGQTDDPRWMEKVELIHKSIERTATMERYINDFSWIPACPTRFPGCITIGSTKKSYAKFWVGVGALERSGDAFNELVLTRTQLASAAFDVETVKINGLSGKNFSSIRVLR